MLDNETLRAAAQERGGPFTLADAKAAGASVYDVRRAIAAEGWRRLHPGVFVDDRWYRALSPEDTHLVDLRARLLVLDEGWCAARRSAAVLHGLPLLGNSPQVPQLVRDRPTTQTRGSSRHERFNTLPECERTEVGGIRATTVARTVVDLARVESFTSGVVVADAALRAGTPIEELLAVSERCAAWPRAPRVRPVLAHADGRAESPLESLSRAGFVRQGIPRPELQTEVWHRGAHVARADFLWRHALVVGEADGRSKYESVEDFYAEKRREERLRDLGFEVVRWDWASALHPERGLLDVLARAFARGALNRLAPGVELRVAEVPRAA